MIRNVKNGQYEFTNGNFDTLLYSSDIKCEVLAKSLLIVSNHYDMIELA